MVGTFFHASAVFSHIAAELVIRPHFSDESGAVHLQALGNLRKITEVFKGLPVARVLTATTQRVVDCQVPSSPLE